jgi:hypothetical protein
MDCLSNAAFSAWEIEGEWDGWEEKRREKKGGEMWRGKGNDDYDREERKDKNRIE